MDILFAHKETVSELTMREMYETNAHRSNVQNIAILYYIVLNLWVLWLGGTVKYHWPFFTNKVKGLIVFL